MVATSAVLRTARRSAPLAAVLLAFMFGGWTPICPTTLVATLCCLQHVPNAQCFLSGQPAQQPQPTNSRPPTTTSDTPLMPAYSTVPDSGHLRAVLWGLLVFVVASVSREGSSRKPMG